MKTLVIIPAIVLLCELIFVFLYGHLHLFAFNKRIESKIDMRMIMAIIFTAFGVILTCIIYSIVGDVKYKLWVGITEFIALIVLIFSWPLEYYDPERMNKK